MTPMKAIRAKCLDCCCGSFHEVRLCTAEKCPLFPYRFGKRPNRAGTESHNALFSSSNPNLAKDSEEELSGEYKDTTPGESSAEPPVRTGVFEETEE